MNLSDILLVECISFDVPSSDKTGVIRHMVELSAKSKKVSSQDQLFDSVMKREEIQTTGIGHGMAIPHATAEGVKGLVLSLGISKEGVEYSSLDHKPVHLIFLLAGEPRLQTSFLSILSKISRFFKQEEFRNQIIQSKDADTILSLIQSREDN
jgi:fructose-specific phosphotransferase system IIA component